MTNEQPHYFRIANGFDTVLRGVQENQWSLPTPCTDWDVRALAIHVVETHRRVYSMIAEDVGEVEVGDQDVLGAWAQATGAIQSAISDPARASTPVRGRSGEQPFSSLVAGLLSMDTICHTWDLARATGQDEQLDADALLKLHEVMMPMDDAIRVPGGFAPRIEPSSDASAQTRFLNFAGRHV